MAYALALVFLYFFQEWFLFYPSKISRDYEYKFDTNFTEGYFKSNENELNFLHFYATNPKGAVLFIHGNSDDLRRWGGLSPIYTRLGLDFYTYDYPGFGKSSGKIKNETELFEDAKNALELVKKDFLPQDIIVVGYSLGTGIASHLVCTQNLPNLVLFAPYFSMESEIAQVSKIVPNFIVRYPIRTNKFLADCGANITIIHGDEDRLINIKNGRNLAKILKNGEYYEISGANHNSVIIDEKSVKILEKRLK